MGEALCGRVVVCEDLCALGLRRTACESVQFVMLSRRGLAWVRREVDFRRGDAKKPKQSRRKTTQEYEDYKGIPSRDM